MILFEITAKSLVSVQQKIKPKVLDDEDLNRYGKMKSHRLLGSFSFQFFTRLAAVFAEENGHD